MSSHLINYIIVWCGVIIIWEIWRLYTLIRTPAFLILMVAFVYLTLYRLALPRYPVITNYGIAIPFYILALIAFHILFKAIYDSLHSNHQAKKALDMHRDTFQLSVQNLWMWLFTSGILLIILYLEITER